jgi:hypothetical protein
VQGAVDLRGSVRARVGNFVREIENLKEALGADPTPLHHIHQGAGGAHGLDHHGHIGEEGHEASRGEGPLLHERPAVAEDDQRPDGGEARHDGGHEGVDPGLV